MPGRVMSATSGRAPAGVRIKEERTRRSRAEVEEPEAGDDTADQDAEGEEDAENPVDDADDQGEGSSRGVKRSRVNENGDSVPSDSQSPPPERIRVKTQPRDVDGFIPGSIVRIQLENFVTYDWVEFFPGAYLNMILGPNGTGKSSIACAICLGLNFPPSVLGRASDLNLFVKHGHSEGHIEIELKGSLGKPNVIIRRMLKSTSKSSQFLLNGKSASGRDINAKMAELNVQVGNLCSFLPQDRVSEFAQMTPQQLLRETQRAAGDENLTTWHDTLISAGKELKQLQELMGGERDQLKTMQERNEGLEREVQRYNERKQIEHDIALLEILLPVQRYREHRVKCLEVKEQSRILHAKVIKLKEKNAPAHDLLQKLTTQHKDHEKRREELKRSTQQKFKKMTEKWDGNGKLETAMGEEEDKLHRLKEQEKERQKKMKRYESDIAGYEAELAVKVEVEDISDVKRDADQISAERIPLQKRYAAWQASYREIVNTKVTQQGRIEGCNARLKQLDDASTRKLQQFERWDRDHADAVRWLRANQNKFEKEIFEPPILSVSIPDKRYADAVESFFNQNTMKTFVMQTQRDYDLFNKYMHTEHALGQNRKVRINTWFRPYNEESVSEPPMSPTELEEVGFDGYALQFIEYPKGMEWWLKDSVGLHRYAIGISRQVDVQRAMQAVTRIGPNGRGGNGASFIVGNVVHQVSRSRYGKRAVQNMTRDVRPARNLVNASVDQEVKSRIESEMREYQTELDMALARQKELDDEKRAIEAEDEGFKKRMIEVQARRKVIQDEQARVGALKSKLERITRALQDLQKVPPADQKRAQIKKEINRLARERTKLARDYVELSKAVVAEQKEATKAGLEYLQIGANKAALAELCKRKDERYEIALAAWHEVNEEYKRLKATTQVILAESKAIVEAADAANPEIYEEFNEIGRIRMEWDQEVKEANDAGRTPPPGDHIEQRSAEQLEADLEEQRNRLELNLNTNPGVIEQYERRKQEIENMTRTLEEKQKKVDRIERNIKNARDNWQPALEDLVQSIGKKFSAAFDRIGCAGEIRISEHEDYEKWAIDILVKFRSTEKLQLLTGQRQSGGERSLTTILYLMSLTEEARAPFSLVDEINQGMDQRAERNVHNSMVDVTCKEDSAQYFLITPKLLPDLNYHERMRILCVNNGEWLPEERGLGDMMGMINNYHQLRNRAQNSN
ncbi:Structural maintenance of chromosomes protein 5 [Pleurotus ostreatus]|uniref:Structural maintenance of chromosomes protein 5 n=1 Tax=Pleurotus ostreatus TaxID=5322 RepID=A0A8H6ZY76_PLEOS|nr:Structural maintenance of chromosomes protein 5 [Pleurotus ostreatus]KAF7432634.1 Structural maintenance of chromosomes protein 5 [Pleurotus ostreatus]KAJ8698851.1 Structural maintenance of chromosomes protein 5 [Pleurotus ostreatus]